MRIPLAVLAVACAIAATASAQSPQPSAGYGEALFVVSGRGWGHGVGMSQYGAYGMARAGRTYDQILAHYYSGTELGSAKTKDVRVLLAEGRGAVTISSQAKVTVKDAAGQTFRLGAGPITLEADLELPVSPDAPLASRPKPVPPLLVVPGKTSAPLSLDGRQYRGKLELAVQNGFLRVVNVVGLEPYLQGVVAGEMPYTWPAEALKAQAVAARSYALSRFLKGKPFDLYADVRSQVYLGVAGERPSTNQALQATRGEVVTYQGKIASTLYHSSSGGRTASAADVFGTPIPYLLSRPDPWDKASPNHRWGPLLFGAHTMQTKLGADARVVDAKAAVTPSGRLRSLVLATASGSEAVPASLVRSALGLRSTWLTVGVVRLDRPVSGAVVFGSTVRLAGVVRGLDPARLSSSADGAKWSQAAELAPDPTGSVAIETKPTRTTRYRIEVDGAASPAQLVQVAPRVELAETSVPGVLAGSVRPRLAGILVAIERKKGSAWVRVAEAAVDASGSFQADAPLAPGTYRARIPATNGLAEARSAAIQVTG